MESASRQLAAGGHHMLVIREAELSSAIDAERRKGRWRNLARAARTALTASALGR